MTPHEGLRLGLVAPEFPPDLGGMAELAQGLASALAEIDEVTVFTRPGHHLADARFQQQAVLSGKLAADARTLATAKVDVWLGLNAGLMPLATQLEKPFYIYLHGNDFLNPWLACGGWIDLFAKPYCAPLRKQLRRAAIRRHEGSARGLFTNSHGTADAIKRHLGIPGHRIQVVPPGVDSVFFQSKETQRGQLLRLLTVSRLSRYVPRKNIDGVLRAVHLLADTLPIQYTVVGDGDDLPRLRCLATELGIADRVTFTGRADKKALLTHYAEADLFVLASLASAHDVEGFGIVYMEAAAAGVPSLCSREGGAIDAVEEGENGVVLASSSPQAIADGVLEFSKSRDQYPAERVRAVAERFRWPVIADTMRSSILAIENGS